MTQPQLSQKRKKREKKPGPYHADASGQQVGPYHADASGQQVGPYHADASGQQVGPYHADVRKATNKLQ